MFRGGKIPTGYESPINVEFILDFAKQLEAAEDAAIMGEVKMHVDVDKDELLKALAYDRGQYEKGYKDGYDKGVEDGANRMFKRLKEFLMPRGEDNG